MQIGTVVSNTSTENMKVQIGSAITQSGLILHYIDENGGTYNSEGLNHISKDVDDSRPDVQVLLTLLFLVFPGFFFYFNVLSYCFHVT